MTEKVYFKHTLGQKLAGVLSVPIKSDHVVIISHGFTSNKDRPKYRQIQELLNRQGISSLRLDAWGHGVSEGNLAEITTDKGIQSIESAIKYLKTKDFKRFSLIGFSYGGFCSIVVASKIKIEKLAIISPAIDYPACYELEFSKDFIKKWKEQGYFLRSNRDDTKNRINYTMYESTLKYDLFKLTDKIKCPTLLIQGDQDEEVIPKDTIKFGKALKNAEIKIIKASDHAYTKPEHLKKMLNYIVEFFA